MKRSDINRGYRRAVAFFRKQHWTLPPKPMWDITDFGIGDFRAIGLTLVTLANHPEYCEKIMYIRRNQLTPCHAHKKKKEDIIARAGSLTLRLWPSRPKAGRNVRPFGAHVPLRADRTFTALVDGQPRKVTAGRPITIKAGSRITLVPGVWHEFHTSDAEAMIGEVSTANDDLHDNFFIDPRIGRYAAIEEDERPVVRLVNEA